MTSREQPERKSIFYDPTIIIENRRLKRDHLGNSMVKRDCKGILRYVFDTENLEIDERSTVDNRIPHKEITPIQVDNLRLIVETSLDIIKEGSRRSEINYEMEQTDDYRFKRLAHLGVLEIVEM